MTVTLNKCYERELLCYSFTFMHEMFQHSKLNNKYHLNDDKIILPEVVIDTLMKFEVEGPYMFQLQNRNTKKSIYVGVIDFTANNCTTYVPNRMMKELDIKEGERININSVTLPKCTQVTIGMSKEFSENHDPKGVLEYNLRGKACLYLNQKIQIEYTGDTYILEVLNLEPADQVSILNSDISLNLMVFNR